MYVCNYVCMYVCISAHDMSLYDYNRVSGFSPSHTLHQRREGLECIISFGHRACGVGSIGPIFSLLPSKDKARNAGPIRAYGLGFARAAAAPQPPANPEKPRPRERLHPSREPVLCVLCCVTLASILREQESRIQGLRSNLPPAPHTSPSIYCTPTVFLPHARNACGVQNTKSAPCASLETPRRLPSHPACQKVSASSHGVWRDQLQQGTPTE